MDKRDIYIYVHVYIYVHTWTTGQYLHVFALICTYLHVFSNCMFHLYIYIHRSIYTYFHIGQIHSRTPDRARHAGQLLLTFVTN